MILFCIVSEFLQCFVSYLYVCVHGCCRSRCRRHHQCPLINGRKPSSSPLFTCVTFSFCILRKVGLEWRCWRCVFYRRCRLFRAGGGHPLQYRDVMVVTSDTSQLQDDVTDEQMTSSASGFVVGLRGEGVPVCVLEGSDRVLGIDNDSRRVVDRAGWKKRVKDVALSQTDQVSVSGWECVQGLERRVVVWLSDRWWGKKNWRHISYLAVPAISRCTTQLIIVSPPPPDDRDSDSTDDEDRRMTTLMMQALGFDDDNDTTIVCRRKQRLDGDVCVVGVMMMMTMND